MAKGIQIIFEHKKTHFMIFTRKKLQKKLTLSIDNQPIHQVESSKFLGLYIDEKLYWKLHISYLAGKIARGVGIILKARKYFTNECMVQLYNAFIVPYMMYCNQIWGSTYKSNLRKLQVLQNKAVRIITGSSRKTSIEWMYNEFRILNLYEINLYLVGKFMFKVFHEDVPNVFDNFFTDDYSIHEHNARSSQHLHIPLCVSNWNEVPRAYHMEQYS